MRATIKKMAKLVGLGACALVLSTERSRATASLTLFDGTTTVSVLDGSVLDSNAAVGAITFNGALGVWFLNVSTGFTKPVQGSAADPSMDLNSIDRSSGAGTLKITFKDDGFTATAGTVIAGIGGTQQNGTTKYTVLQDLNQLINTGAIGGSPFTGTGSAALSGATNYSLTQEVFITHTGVGTTSWDASLDVTLVPEGDTKFAMLGLGVIVGAAALRRRFLPA